MVKNSNSDIRENNGSSREKLKSSSENNANIISKSIFTIQILTCYLSTCYGSDFCSEMYYIGYAASELRLNDFGACLSGISDI